MSQCANAFIIGATAFAIATGATNAASKTKCSERTGLLGEFVSLLGEDMTLVVNKFNDRYVISQNSTHPEPPDYSVPEYIVYTVRELRQGGDILGYLYFKEDRLANVTRHVADYKNPDVGPMIADLIQTLKEMDEQGDEPIRVQWDDGEVQGQHIGNSCLFFRSGSSTIEIVSYDSPGASQSVSVSFGINAAIEAESR